MSTVMNGGVSQIPIARPLPVAQRMSVPQPPPMPSAGASPASTKRQAKKPSLALILGLAIPAVIVFMSMVAFSLKGALEERATDRRLDEIGVNIEKALSGG